MRSERSALQVVLRWESDTHGSLATGRIASAGGAPSRSRSCLALRGASRDRARPAKWRPAARRAARLSRLPTSLPLGPLRPWRELADLTSGGGCRGRVMVAIRRVEKPARGFGLRVLLRHGLIEHSRRRRHRLLCSLQSGSAMSGLCHRHFLGREVLQLLLQLDRNALGFVLQLRLRARRGAWMQTPV